MIQEKVRISFKSIVTTHKNRKISFLISPPNTLRIPNTRIYNFTELLLLALKNVIFHSPTSHKFYHNRKIDHIINVNFRITCHKGRGKPGIKYAARTITYLHISDTNHSGTHSMPSVACKNVILYISFQHSTFV